MFLKKFDFEISIREAKLDEITGGDDALLLTRTLDVVEEMSSYFRDRFDVALIFVNILDYDFTTAFVIDDYVALVESQWLVGTTYAINALVSDTNGNVYRSIAGSNVGNLTSDAGSWELWGVNKSIYKSVLGGAGAKPADTLEWTIGDPRDQLVKRFAVDITLFEVHKLINPRQVPEYRILAREDALKWLKMVSDPRNNIIPNLPLITLVDQEGFDIAYGSNTALNHDY